MSDSFHSVLEMNTTYLVWISASHGITILQQGSYDETWKCEVGEATSEKWKVKKGAQKPPLSWVSCTLTFRKFELQI